MAPLPWKYNFTDMWHVVGIFEANEPVLAAALAPDNDDCDSDDEEDNLEAFLSTLDSQVAGREGRPVNVGAICAATRGEWESERRRCVLSTARDFIALGYLEGSEWPRIGPSSCGYLPPTGSTTRSSSSSTSSTSGKRVGGHMDGSGFMSPPTSRSRGNAGEEASPSHLAMRHVPALLRPESITSGSSDFRAVVLLEVLLRDSRGRIEGETVQAYTNYAKRLVKGCFEGTGLKLPFNMNGSLNCYINLGRSPGSSASSIRNLRMPWQSPRSVLVRSPRGAPAASAKLQSTSHSRQSRHRRRCISPSRRRILQ